MFGRVVLNWAWRIAGGQAEPVRLSPHGLASPATTAGGRILKEFLRSARLYRLDCDARGTFMHAWPDESSELSLVFLTAWLRLASCARAAWTRDSDARLRVISVRKNFQRVAWQFQLRVAAFRGPSASAVACREQYKVFVDN